MSEKRKIGAMISLGGEKEYRQATANVTATLKELDAEAKLLDATFEGQKNTLTALEKKHEILSKTFEAQKEKVEANQKGLDNANESYKKFRQRMDETRQALEAAQNALTEMKESGDTSAETLDKQEKEVERLSRTLRDSEKNYATAENRLKRWETELIKSKTELARTNNELNQNEKYLEEARNSTDQCATSIDEFGKKAKSAAQETEEFSSKVSSIEESTSQATEVVTGLGEKIGQAVVTKGVSLAADAAGELVDKVKEVSVESEKASSQLQAATGLSKEMAEKYSEVMESIVGDNYGDGYDDVADAMTQIIQIMGQMDSSAMEETTKSAIALRDTFRMDYNETIRGADALMKNLGLTSKQAFDYITKGAQNGLNRSGELVDNLSEYSQIWGQAGFSAEEMFSILDNGLQSGAYNLDKVNDYVKEFTISLSDGRIAENIDSFSSGTKSLFESWQNGEATARDVFYSVISDLSDMENQQEALTLASNTWSSLGEDNAMKVITALDDVNAKYANVTGAAESLNEVKYDDIGSSLELLGKNVVEKVVNPIVDVAVPAIKDAVDMLNEAFEGVGTSGVEDVTEEFKETSASIRELAAERKVTAENLQEEVTSIDTYSAKLIELQSIEERDGQYKLELVNIMKEMGNLIPEITAAYDTETHSLALSTEQIEAYAKARKNALTTDVELQNQENLTASIDATKKAISDLEIILAQYAIKAEENGGYLMDNDKWDMEFQQQQLTALQENLSRYEKELQDSQKAVEELAKAEEKASKAYKSASGNLEIVFDDTEIYRESVEETSEAVEDMAENTEDAMKQMAEAAKMTADSQKEAFSKVKETYDDLKESAKNSLNFDFFGDSFNGGIDLTVEKMLSNSETQLEGLRNYQKNLAEVRDHVGKEIAPEFMEYLEGMGTDAANILNHICITFKQDNGTELITEWSNNYLEAIDIQDREATIMAANKVALENGLGELGSTDTDFSELDTAIKNAVDNTVDGWKELPEEMKTALEEETATLQNIGAKIPEGLAEGITNGEIAPQTAIDAMKASIQGHFDGFAEIAQDLGLKIPEELQTGIDEGGTAAVTAFEELIALISGKTGEMKTVGEEAAEEQAAGLTESSGDVETAATDVADAAATAAGGKVENFKEVGKNLSKGIAVGILLEKGTVIKATTDVMDAAESAAKEEADINSPSKEWEDEIGANLTLGAAKGVLKESATLEEAATTVVSTAGKAAKKTVKEVLEELDDELDDTLSDKTLKKISGNFGISKADDSGEAKTTEKYNSEVYSAAKKYLDNQDTLYDISIAAQINYWKKVRQNLTKGTDAWYSATKEIKSLQQEKKDAQADAYDQIIENAEEYVRRRKLLGKMDEAGELEYWETILGSVKKGTDAWYDALEKVNDLKAEASERVTEAAEEAVKKAQEAIEMDTEAMEAEKQAAQDALSTRASVQDKLLSGYKTYQKVSERAEMQYWDIARKQFETGTEERIAADQKYFEAKQAYYDRLEELEEEYVSNTKAVDEQLREEIQNLTDEYTDAVKSRTEAIKSSFGLFDEFYSESDSGEKLLENLKSQVAGIADWEKEIAKLGARGISEGLLKELQAIGPEAAASIHALNSLTAEELNEYDTLWKQRNALAESQAVKENEPLRRENQQKIEQAKEDAQKQLDEYTTAYKEGIAETTQGIPADLKYLANVAATATEEAVAGLLSGLTANVDTNQIQSKVGDAVTTISSELGKLSQAGKAIGNDALIGLMDGMTDEEVIAQKSKTLYEQLQAVYKQEAQIASDTYILELQKKLQNTQLAVSGMNQTIAATANYNPVITMSANMSALEAKMDRLVVLAEEYYPQIAEGTDVVLDGDSVAAKVTEKVSQNLASSLSYSR